MSLYHGLLLFDVPEAPIGDWQENLGGRGLIDKWEIPGRFTLLIDSYDGNCSRCAEGECECHEWWVESEPNGDSVTDGYGDTYDQAKAEAVQWMREHPQGITRRTI